MKLSDHPPALSAVVHMVCNRALEANLPDDLMGIAMSAGVGDEDADLTLKMLLRGAAVGNKGAAAAKVWPADEDILIAMSIRDGLRAAAAVEAVEAASTDRMQTVIVNGQSYEVPRSANDHCLGFAERAVEMAGYEMSMSRRWEVKDEAGEVLGYKDDPGRVRYVSLRAGIAS